ncbi:hypothetical protein Hanom_Chr17g01545881 [Helianthus anomalus]
MHAHAHTHEGDLLKGGLVFQRCIHKQSFKEHDKTAMSYQICVYSKHQKGLLNGGRPVFHRCKQQK